MCLSIAMYNKAQVVLHFDRKGGKVGREGNKEWRGAQKRTFFPIFCNLFLVQAIATD